MDNESLPIKGETRHLFKSETGYMNLLQSSDQGSCSLFRNYYSPSFRAELKTVPLNFVVKQYCITTVFTTKFNRTDVTYSL